MAKASRCAAMIVAVPPPASVGLSPWGDHGDGDGVTIVFECELQNRIVSAFNVTSWIVAAGCAAC